jgi:biotin carboxyl carrier protein/GAF domain-containing protein
MSSTIQQSSDGPSQITADDQYPEPSTASTPKRLSEAVWNAFRSSDSQQSFLRKVMDSIGEHFESPFARISLEDNQGNNVLTFAIDDAAEDAWAKRCAGPMLDSRYRNQPASRVYHAPKANEDWAIIACPVSFSSESCQGAIAVVIPYQSDERIASQIQELQTTVSMAATMALDIGPKKQKVSEPSMSDPNTASKVAGYRSVSEFGFAIVNNLKVKLGCESVSFGLVRSNRVRLICISGSAFVDPRSIGTHQIEQVMDEALDADEICCVQTDQDSRQVINTSYLLHRDWHATSGGAAVASIPLKVDGKCIAILSLRHVPGQTFSSEQLEKVRELAAPLIPGVVLLDRADRSLRDQALFGLQAWFREKLCADTGTRRMMMGAVVALGTFVAVGKQTYYVSAPATIMPSDEREIAAPFEGTLSRVFVKPGDSVKAGQTLLAMDTKQLMLDLKQAMADHAAAEMESVQGAAAGDATRAAIARAKADAATGLASKIEQKISLANVRAPSDGTVLSGDLERRLGEPVSVGTPLLVFAPLGRWKVVVEAPEFAADYLAAGQQGFFSADAKPAVSIPLSIDHVNASAEAREGKNVILTNAIVMGSGESWIRSGMRGTSQIDIGKYPVWWVWGHRLIDKVRIRMWSL